MPASEESMAPSNDSTGCFSGPVHFLTHLFNKLRDFLQGRNNSDVQPGENNTENQNQTTTTTMVNVEKGKERFGFLGGSKHDDVAEASIKLNSGKTREESERKQQFSDDEDVCPTCLEEYYPENPKITTKCCHDFHLSCIYEWKERSDRCPVCYRVMVFDESV